MELQYPRLGDLEDKMILELELAMGLTTPDPVASSDGLFGVCGEIAELLISNFQRLHDCKSDTVVRSSKGDHFLTPKWVSWAPPPPPPPLNIGRIDVEGGL